MPLFFRSASVGLAVLAMAGCNDPVTVPTAPTPVAITESFAGTLTVSGGVTHPFSATGPGSLTATLTAVGPDEEPTVGLSLGTWNGSSCAVVIRQDAAVRTSVIYGTVSQAGQLCVSIYDVGRISSPQDYEITVVHP